VVGYSTLFFGCDFIGDDRQTFVHLHSITIDDLAVEAQRQIDGQLAVVISWRGTMRGRMRGHGTWDFPVPVAPMMAMTGFLGREEAIEAV